MKNRFLLLFLIMCSSVSYLSALDQYVGAWGGISLADDRIDGYTIDFDIGPAAGIVYGVRCPHNIRVEIEECYRQSNIDDILAEGVSSGVSGHLQEWAAFVNVLYDFPLCSRVIPFFGFGLGWEYEKTDLKATGCKSIEAVDSAFSSQAIAGLHYHCNDCVSLFISYRHYLFHDDIQSSALGLGVTYRLR